MKRKPRRKRAEYHWEYCAWCKTSYMFFRAYTRRTKIHEVARKADWLVQEDGSIVCPACLFARRRKQSGGNII